MSHSCWHRGNLEGNRNYKYPKTFPVLPARPQIEANEKKEIDGVILDADKTNRFDLSEYPVVPIDTESIKISVKSKLADYSLKTENISIETRIEDAQVGQEALPQATFEVLDTFNLNIAFQFGPQNQQFLAGRRLQFRIKDRKRGDSDWYTIRQTFIRIPKIISVSCFGGACKIKGTGLDYIGQISTDGGNVWQPPTPVQPTPDGKSLMTIQGAKSKALLRIKLRDFMATEGLPVK